MNFDERQTLLVWAAQVLLAAMRDRAWQQDTLLGPYVRDYLTSLHRRKAERTIESYEETLAWLCLEFPDRKPDEISTNDLRDWIQRRWGHLRPATERQRTAAIRMFFRWAEDEERIERDPARKLDPPPLRDSDSEPRQAHPDKIEQLLGAQPKLRDRIAIQLLADLGFRRNELRLFQLRHFTAQTGHVRVQHGKGGKTRALRATARLQTDLGQYLQWEKHGTEEYLLHPWGKVRQPMQPSSIHYWWGQCLERAGLPDSILMHEMRYTAATGLYEDTKDLIMVQRFLGHSDPKTTARYLDLDPTGLDDALFARRNSPNSPTPDLALLRGSA